MKRAILVISVFSMLFSTYAGAAQNSIPKQLRDEIVLDLTENILPFWAKYSPDPSGGFYGTLLFDASPKPDAEKGGILNARLLWTFSTAYRMLKDENYKVLADRAQRYFIDYFIDKKYGGTFLSVKADGAPFDTQKMTYQNAFAIYGLSEHYRATGNKESLSAAVGIYKKMIRHAYDPVYGGFIELFSRDWKEVDQASPKTMNTNLHILEALTNLYRVWKDPDLKKQLKRQVDVMSNKVLDQKTWHEHLYLTKDWQNQSDINSYGHDIEFSWLLVEAAEVLGDESMIENTKRMAVHIAEVQLDQGINSEGAMMYEKSGTRLNENLEWWPQTESIVGFLNAWQISGEKKYLGAATRLWNWIKKHMIDYEYGEWYSNIKLDGTPEKTRVKADQWRCPYHNSRMGFEIMTRASNDF